MCAHYIANCGMLYFFTHRREKNKQKTNKTKQNKKVVDKNCSIFGDVVVLAAQRFGTFFDESASSIVVALMKRLRVKLWTEVRTNPEHEPTRLILSLNNKPRNMLDSVPDVD